MQYQFQISIILIFGIAIFSWGCTKSYNKEDFIGEWEGSSLTIHQPENPNIKSKIKLKLYENDSFFLSSSKQQCRPPDIGKYDFTKEELYLIIYDPFENTMFIDTFAILAQNNESLVLKNSNTFNYTTFQLTKTN